MGRSKRRKDPEGVGVLREKSLGLAIVRMRSILDLIARPIPLNKSSSKFAAYIVA